MSTVPSPRRATVEDWLKYPEDARVELIHGEIVGMSPPTFGHGAVQGELVLELGGPFGRGRGGPGGWRFIPEIDLLLPLGDVVRPDLAGWRAERAPPSDTPHPCASLPDFIAEVVSPTSGFRDRVSKSRLYGEAGIPWYWIVDPAQRTIEVFQNRDGHMALIGGADAEAAEARLPPFEAAALDIRRLFAA